MNIILSRHGNTFGPADPVVWAGSANDPPLVEKGLAQAEKFAQALKARKIRPAAVYCSPLQRTSTYAKVIIDRLELSFFATVDDRLNEIDYGEWTGLTNDQIKARFGESALKGWNERSEWPVQGRWGSSPSVLIAEITALVDGLIRKYRKNETVVLVTSNGRLRYFLSLVEGEFEKRVGNGSFKVKTGNICMLVHESGQWRVSHWDADPNVLADL